MLDLSKRYKTADGREVKQLTYFPDADECSKLVGCVEGTIYYWYSDGRFTQDFDTPGYNLVEDKPKEYTFQEALVFCEKHPEKTLIRKDVEHSGSLPFMMRFSEDEHYFQTGSGKGFKLHPDDYKYTWVEVK
jgi:hypothetical protein